MVHNYQENCILECSRSTDSRSDFFTFFLQRMSDCGVDLYGDGELLFFNVGPEHFVEYRILPGKGRLKDEMLVIVMKMVVLVS